MSASRKDRRRAPPLAPPPAAPGSSSWFWPAAIFLIACAAFLPALHNHFVNWDDDKLLVDNLAYRGFAWRNVSWMFTTLWLSNYTPLSWLSYAFDYGLWGMDPRGYHLTNIVLHGLDAAVLYAVALRILARARPAAAAENPSGLRFGAAAAALFFALHPLRVESVAWAAERRDVLSGLFYLLTVLFYLRAQAVTSTDSSRGRLMRISLVFCLLSLLSKGMGVTLPFALLILDFYPLGRLPAGGVWNSPESRRVWAEKIPYLLLSLVFGAVGIAGQSRAGALKSVAALGLSERVARASFGTLFYLWKTAVPFHLSPTYPPSVDMSLANPLYLGALALLVAASVAAFALRRRFPAAAAAWAFYVITLAPVNGLVNFGGPAAADRYTYLPGLAWALLLGALFVRPRDTGGALPRRELAAILLAGLFALTWRQTGIWRDSETFWRYSISQEPRLAFSHAKLGETLTSEGRYGEAETELRAALELDPKVAGGQMNWGVALMRENRPAEAVEHYLAGLKLSPDDAQDLSNLCAARASLDRLEEARPDCERALALDPSLKDARLNLGVVLAREGRVDEAIAQFRAALALDPGFAEARNDLARALRLQAPRATP